MVAGVRGAGNRGVAEFTHTQPPTHTLARTHTHLIVMRGVKGASCLVSAGVWHGFEVFPAIGRFCGQAVRRGERTRRICSPIRWGIGTVSTPGIFPPLSPQCHPLEGAERQTRGRLLYACREPVLLKAGAGWRTDRHRVRSWARGDGNYGVASPPETPDWRLCGACVCPGRAPEW